MRGSNPPFGICPHMMILPLRSLAASGHALRTALRRAGFGEPCLEFRGHTFAPSVSNVLPTHRRPLAGPTSFRGLRVGDCGRAGEEQRYVFGAPLPVCQPRGGLSPAMVAGTRPTFISITHVRWCSVGSLARCVVPSQMTVSEAGGHRVSCATLLPLSHDRASARSRSQHQQVADGWRATCAQLGSRHCSCGREAFANPAGRIGRRAAEMAHASPRCGTARTSACSQRSM